MISTKQTILSEEIRNIEHENNCILKEREKYFLLNMFNQNLLEVHLAINLKKIMKTHKIFANFDNDNLNKIISKMIVKNYQIGDIISNQTIKEKKIFVILQGIIQQKNVCFLYQKLLFIINKGI